MKLQLTVLNTALFVLINVKWRFFYWIFINLFLHIETITSDAAISGWASVTLQLKRYFPTKLSSTHLGFDFGSSDNRFEWSKQTEGQKKSKSRKAICIKWHVFFCWPIPLRSGWFYCMLIGRMAEVISVYVTDHQQRQH